MVNREKTMLMAKCAIYESGGGEKDISISKYNKFYYILSSTIKNVLLYTIAYGMIIGLYSFTELNYFVKNIFSQDIDVFIYKFIYLYVAIIGLLIIPNVIFYNRRYNKVIKRLKSYDKVLGKINELNLLEEKVEDLLIDSENISGKA